MKRQYVRKPEKLDTIKWGMIGIIVIVLLLLSSCNSGMITTENSVATNQESRILTAELFVESIRKTADFIQPTYTPYPTFTAIPLPTATEIPDCPDGWTQIITTVQARLYTPVWRNYADQDKCTDFKRGGSGNKLMLLLISKKKHSGILSGILICSFGKIHADGGAFWGFSYFIDDTTYMNKMNYAGNLCGFYLKASDVNRID